MLSGLPVFLLFFAVLNLYAGFHGFLFVRAIREKTALKFPLWLYFPLFLLAAVLYGYIKTGGTIRGMFGLADAYWGLAVFLPFLVIIDFITIIIKIIKLLSLFQNSVSFGKGFGKSGKKPAFSPKSKVAFPKTEVLGKPLFNQQPPSFFSGPGSSIALHLGAIILACAVIFYGLFNARHARITEYEITTEKKLPKKEVSVILVSDLHIGAMVHKKLLGRMADKINSLEGDIILIAGDIIDRDMKAFDSEKLGEEFSRLKAPYGVWAVPGNHEYFGGDLERLDEALKASGVTLLEDESALAGGAFNIIGRSDLSVSRRGITRKTLGELTGALDSGIPVIVLDHQPRNLGEAETAGVDIQLSGHTHHGQIWPGPIITGRMYENDYGLIYKGKTAIIVTSGFGTWGPPLRIGTIAEIVRITLKEP
jgi:predicted MPP superfamily phosphohydrolase